MNADKIKTKTKTKNRMDWNRIYSTRCLKCIL
jgi:hypothetical protein